MTNNLQLRLAEIAHANARNKFRIQRKRAKFASTKASLENLPRPTSFPTPYKYG